MIWAMTLLPTALLLSDLPIYITLCDLRDRHRLLLFHPGDGIAADHVRVAGQFGAFGGAVLYLAGEIMGTGGISRRLVDWSRSLLRGTLARACRSRPFRTALCSAPYPASSAATVASVGRITLQADDRGRLRSSNSPPGFSRHPA